MTRPTPVVAARRRRTIIWTPAALLGMVLMLAAYQSALAAAPNGVWLLGALLAIGGTSCVLVDDGKVRA